MVHLLATQASFQDSIYFLYYRLVSHWQTYSFLSKSILERLPE